jgi:sucrose-6-phosphate hydrolase SacC (GH32 family)
MRRFILASGPPIRPRFLAIALVLLTLGTAAESGATTCSDNDPCSVSNCDPALAYPLGAATARMLPPFTFRAKDFAFTKFNGTYHLFYTLHDRAICKEEEVGNAITFGHSVSTDLENWTYTGTVLGAGIHAWDGLHIWAPTVVQKDVYHYMFFTGVDGASQNGQQRIGGARMRNDVSPTLSQGWTEFPAGSIDKTNPILTCGTEIPGCLCGPSVGNTAEVRDPFVMRDTQLRNGETTPGWLMYYVTVPQDLTPAGNYVVNVAWARYDDPTNWIHLTRLRATHYGSHQWSHKIESPHLFQRGSTWYLFFTGDQGIEYVSGTNPVGDLPNDWGNHTLLTSALGSSFASFHPENWFASEYLLDGSHEYLSWIHDFNPPLDDPLCSTVGCQEVRPVEIREMLWSGNTFTLADPNPVRTADWVQAFTGDNCYCDLGLTFLDPKSRTASLVAVRILDDGSEQTYPMSAVGFPSSVAMGTSASTNLHHRIQNPDIPHTFRFKVRVTSQARVVESDVIEIEGDVQCSSGGGGGGPFEIPEAQTPPSETDVPKELGLMVLGTGTPDRVTLRLDLPGPTRVKLEVFDASGRHVRTLADETFAAGRVSRVWDGRDDHGASVGAGIYFARMSTLLGERRSRVLLQR